MTLTRRSFVSTSTAAVAASAAVAVPVAIAAAYTHLPALARTYKEADEALHAAYDAWNAAAALPVRQEPA